MTGAAIAMPPRGTRARRTDSSPSLISISARFDSSRRSMSFLILRRSMAGLWSMLGRRGQTLQRGLEREAVAGRAEAGDHAHGEVAEVTGAAEGLARVGVGQVDFDERQADRGQGIAQRYRGVGEPGGVHQEEVGAVRA